MRIAISTLLAVAFLCFAGSAQAQVPNGSYLRSCTDIAMHGHRLTAVCRQKTGRMQRTALTHVGQCVGDIGNQNGVLACARRPGPPAAKGPAIVYRADCHALVADYQHLHWRFYHSYTFAQRERTGQRMRVLKMQMVRSHCPR